jgi:hypothetical protein
MTNVIPNVFYRLFFVILISFAFNIETLLANNVIGEKETLNQYSAWNSNYNIGDLSYNNRISDIINHFYPLKESLKNDDVGYDFKSLAGQPFSMSPYNGVFYPITKLSKYFDTKKFWTLLSVIEKTLYIFIVLEIFLQLGASFVPSLIGSFIAAYSGHNLTLPLPWDFSTILFQALLLYGIVRFVVTKSLLSLFFIPIGLMLSVAAGHLEYVFYLTFSSFIFGFLLCRLNIYKTNSLDYIYFIVFALFIGVILSYAPLLEYYELSKYSQRGLGSGEYTSAFTQASLRQNITPLTFLSIFIPGTHFENLFIGSFALMVIFGALFEFKTDKLIILSLKMVIFSFIFALIIPFLYFIINKLPIVSQFRGSGRIGVVFPIFMGMSFALSHSKFITSIKTSEVINIKSDKIHSIFLLTYVLLFFILISLFGLSYIDKYVDIESSKLLFGKIKKGLYWDYLSLILFISFNIVGIFLIKINSKQFGLKKVFNNSIFCSLILLTTFIASKSVLQIEKNINIFPKSSVFQKLDELNKKEIQEFGWAPRYIFVDSAPFRTPEFFGIEQSGGYTSVFKKGYLELTNSIKINAGIDVNTDVSVTSVSFPVEILSSDFLPLL